VGGGKSTFWAVAEPAAITAAAKRVKVLISVEYDSG